VWGTRPVSQCAHYSTDLKGSVLSNIFPGAPSVGGLSVKELNVSSIKLPGAILNNMRSMLARRVEHKDVRNSLTLGAN